MNWNSHLLLPNGAPFFRRRAPSGVYARVVDALGRPFHLCYGEDSESLLTLLFKSAHQLTRRLSPQAGIAAPAFMVYIR